MFKAKYPVRNGRKTNEDDEDEFLRRVSKYVARINYGHFKQFNRPIETLDIGTFIAIKKRHNVSIENLFI